MSNNITISTPSLINNLNMNVIKRNGNIEEVSFDKILKRVKQLGNEANINLNYTNLVIKIIDQLYDNITTSKIDTLCAEYCASLSSLHYDYGILASRIAVSNHHKNTSSSLLDVYKTLYFNKDEHNTYFQLITDDLYNFVMEHYEYFETFIDYNRDYLFDFFGFKTLEKAYLIKSNNKIIERPQHMWLRVACTIHRDLDKIKETYDLMSNKYFTHATPTLYNSGTLNQQLSSCFLLATEEDSLDGIFNTLKDCAKISKHAGGIGLHIHNVRAKGSRIKSTNGLSNGIVPMLRVFNDCARYVNQSGKRAGSFAIYLEPWHADIEDFLTMKTNHGDEDMKGRDLFYALWIPDLFMKRVEKNEKWSLMCPSICTNLHNVYGDEFVELYEKYERETVGLKSINARDLWYKILDTQMETGIPYLLYKDACNLKSNQKNLGTIKSSNLCCEIVEFSDNENTAVCNLASIALPSFITYDEINNTHNFDYDKLHYVTKVITTNLNNLIDVNMYPTDKTFVSNNKNRPIGIGVQGLADVFFMLNLPFESHEAKEINVKIFETIYHGAIEQSLELAKQYGHYSTFVGSPASQGILQFDMWGVVPSNRYDWNSLKEDIKIYGIRNSLLVAPMPTASTSQILGFNECFEPITSNIYSRGTIAGEFTLVNKYLMKDLINLGLWDEKIKNNIIANNGSIQQLKFLPDNILKKYKIVWEIPMKHIIDMSKDRGPFICQSQSMNLWQEDPTYKSLTSMHFYSWKCGLKTGMYYLRRKAKASAQQFTIEPEDKSYTNNNSNNNTEICEYCSA